MLKINFSLEKLENKPTLFRFDLLGLIKSFYAKIHLGKIPKGELYFVIFSENLQIQNAQTYQEFLRSHLYLN